MILIIRVRQITGGFMIKLFSLGMIIAIHLLAITYIPQIKSLLGLIDFFLLIMTFPLYVFMVLKLNDFLVKRKVNNKWN